MNIVSMLRNGYRPDGFGNYAKVVKFPNGKQSGNGLNHYVERIVRNRHGQIVRVQHQNKKHI